MDDIIEQYTFLEYFDDCTYFFLATPEHDIPRPETDRVQLVQQECLAQPLPGGLRRGEQNDPGGVDVEPVHDTAAQPPLADAVKLGVARQERAQQGAGLPFAQGMNGNAGGLVDGDPARPGAQHHVGRLGLGDGALLLGSRERGHLDDGLRRQRHPLGARADRTPVDPHGAAGQQPSRGGAGKIELAREEEVEATTSIPLLGPENAGAAVTPGRVPAVGRGRATGGLRW